METVLKVNALKKNYFNKAVLRGINLEIEKGKILGLLGPNGSGKTTFMKILAGILRPTSGEVIINGVKPGIESKAIVSYLSDVNYLFKWMEIKDAVNFFDDFYDDFSVEKSRELLEFMKLDENAKVKTLSKGMLEKLNLTLVLSRSAKLYIFDEPLGGIDPVAREKIIDAIINRISNESSMIISTHLVKDVERLFDDVAFISDGEIILQGNAENLRSEKQKSIDELYREVFENV
jgi:ABC-2 type transport system ATP-binding protein